MTLEVPGLGAMEFFLRNGLAIMVEDFAGWLSILLLGHKASTWRYIVGYVWVIIFMFWSTPVWMYPLREQLKDEKVALFQHWPAYFREHLIASEEWFVTFAEGFLRVWEQLIFYVCFAVLIFCFLIFGKA